MDCAADYRSGSGYLQPDPRENPDPVFHSKRVRDSVVSF
jgi:hypothetical protein